MRDPVLLAFQVEVNAPFLHSVILRRRSGLAAKSELSENISRIQYASQPLHYFVHVLVHQVQQTLAERHLHGFGPYVVRVRVCKVQQAHC